MDEIVIVTAFFDIGRENYDKLKRNNDTYFAQFEYWARIRNHVIVFVANKEHEEQVYNIREKYGEREKTSVIIIEDITKLLPSIYKKMEFNSSDIYYKNIRLMKNTLSDKPLYDLVNYLKIYFIKLAKSYMDHETQFAWMDFGFNHGGSTYPNPEDFDFLWRYDCKEKALFFYENRLDIRPMFEIIRTVKPDPMLGAMFIIPSIHVERIWNSYLESVNAMLDMGFIDDDQPLLLMTFRKVMDIALAMQCRNCEQLKLCGAQHMSYRKKKKSFIILRKIKHYIEYRLLIFSYHKADTKLLLKNIFFED